MPRERRITRMCAVLADRDRGAVTRIAALAGVDRTTVSHWFTTDGARTYPVPADALAAICDALGSVEPLRAIADELGYDLAPRSRPTTSPVPLEAGVWDVLGHASRLGTEVQHAVADGLVDDEEARRLASALTALRDVAEGMLARLPR